MIKKTIHSTTTFILATILSLFFLASVNAQSSQEATYSVSPDSGTTISKSAGTVPFTITVDSGDEPINVVSLTIEYDQSDLEFDSFDSSSSSFEFSAPSEPSGNGVVYITRGSPVVDGLTGQNTVGVVNFRIIGDSGDTTLKFGEDSNIIRIGAVDIWDRNTTIGTYNLVPSTGNDSANESRADEIPTGDNLVALKVVDENNQPLANKVVTIGNRTSITDDSGVASFGSLPPDTFAVEVLDEDGTKIAQSEITVQDDTSGAAVQKFELTVDDSGFPVGLAVSIVLILTATVIAIIFILKKGKITRFSSKKNSINSNIIDYDNIPQQQNRPVQTENNSHSILPTPLAPGDEIHPEDKQ